MITDQMSLFPDADINGNPVKLGSNWSPGWTEEQKINRLAFVIEN